MATAPAGFTTMKPGGNLQAALLKNTPVAIYGEWKLANLKLPKGNTKIWLNDDACLWRTDAQSGATRNGFIINADWNSPIGDVTIFGPGRIQAQKGKTGNLISLWANNITFKEMTHEYWDGGRLYMLGAEGDIQIDGVHFTCDKDSYSGVGGVRISHCASGTVKNCDDCTSGDDLWQAVPAGAPADPLFNKGDVKNLTYINNHRGRSYGGRLCVAGLQDQNDDGTTKLGMKSSVRNVSFFDLDGFGGKSGFVHQNKSSVGIITGTKTRNVVIDQRYATAGQPAEIYMNGITGQGITNCDLSGVKIKPRPKNPKAYYRADGKTSGIVKPPQWNTKAGA